MISQLDTQSTKRLKRTATDFEDTQKQVADTSAKSASKLSGSELSLNFESESNEDKKL